MLVKCPIHPFGILIIIIGLAMCVVSHTAAFSNKEGNEEEQKAEGGAEEPEAAQAQAEEPAAQEEPIAVD
ncbi:unnamed protein product [Tenebrio molitor]|jgi:hypothetical protein|uniref:Uncharacterized protein n=1 Tax=Tenebrio molitor TaxID=7067 RepID=A0A8J6HPB6_TENMO|nr:hypothetical protein GEV33_000376 [Tenebrio molitor]CAH1365752.1 unnamed protein product [Tenebrio molitor]